MTASNQYHCRVGIIGRGAGRCATQFVAYIERDELHDERLDRDFDSRGRREDFVAGGFEVPGECPAEYRELRDRMEGHVWNDRVGVRVTHEFDQLFSRDVEAASDRKDAQLLRVSDFSLPKELSRRGMISVAESVARAEADEGKVVVWAVHGPHEGVDGSDNGNWHVHIAESMRPIDERGFGPKSTVLYHVRDDGGRDGWKSARDLARCHEAGGAWEKVYRYSGEGLTKSEAESRGLDPLADRDSKAPETRRGNLVDWDSKEALLRYRATVERCVREQLSREGLDVEYDRRSYAERGIDREPQIHVGHAATEMAREGERSDRFEENEAIKARNAEHEAAPRDRVEERVAALGGDLSEYRSLSGAARDYVSAAIGYARDVDRLGELRGSVGDDGGYRSEADRQEASFLRSSTLSWRSGEIADKVRDDAWKYYSRIEDPGERAWVSSLLADEPGHAHVAAREAMEAFARADRTGDPADDARAREIYAQMPYGQQVAVWREIAVGAAPGDESFARSGVERDAEDKMEKMIDIRSEREYDELSRAGAGIGDDFAQLVAAMAAAAAQERRADGGHDVMHRRGRGRDDSHIEYQRTVR